MSSHLMAPIAEWDRLREYNTTEPTGMTFHATDKGEGGSSSFGISNVERTSAATENTSIGTERHQKIAKTVTFAAQSAEQKTH